MSFSTDHLRPQLPLVARAVAAAICMLLTGTACDPSRQPPPRKANGGESSGPGLQYVRSFDVEENSAVVNVTPRVRVDPRGGLLVADPSEAQIRRYSPTGKLLWFAGRQGQGPGEFVAATGVARLPSGDIVAADRNGRLTFFDPEGRRAVRTVETRLRRVEDLEVVDDSTLLISGINKAGHPGPRLHVWSIPRSTFRNSFFEPFSRQTNRAAATAVGFVTAALRGDTIAATFGSSDTIYFYLPDGRAVGQIALNSAHFRPAPTAGPGRRITDPRERAEWVSAFDLVVGVDWLNDGTLLILYQSIEAEQAMRRRWHVLGQDRLGSRRFEFQNVSPLILGTDPSSRTIFLVPPDAEAPNRWTVALLLE